MAKRQTVLWGMPAYPQVVIAIRVHFKADHLLQNVAICFRRRHELICSSHWQAWSSLLEEIVLRLVVHMSNFLQESDH